MSHRYNTNTMKKLIIAASALMALYSCTQPKTTEEKPQQATENLKMAAIDDSKVLGFKSQPGIFMLSIGFKNLGTKPVEVNLMDIRGFDEKGYEYAPIEIGVQSIMFNPDTPGHGGSVEFDHIVTSVKYHGVSAKVCADKGAIINL